ncbi:spike base protein, RCAP_Rcc01079 family [Bradyrhizobium japonicum]|uniref:spike base protein, RCAP_Rcc01079 family n=1 Tax=Bradyrhizobium japonicum TaxID=375 RepID=UPI000410D5D5|nr:hypothetical protein [Bradyrhizobium japonicum]
MAPRPGAALRGDTTGIRSAAAVDISSTDATLTNITRGLYVGVSGNVVVQFSDDADSATVTLKNLVAGVWHPIQVQKIIKSGTTATDIVAGY